jgi:hypothetical protein
MPERAPIDITGVHFWVEIGLRERDGTPGLSAGDYDSRLAMAFDSVDLVPVGDHLFASDAAFLRGVWESMLGRAATSGEKQRIERLAAAGDRAAAAAVLLRDRTLQSSTFAALRLQQVAFDGEFDDALLASQRDALRDGRLQPMDTARALAVAPRLQAERRRLGDRALVERLHASALGAAAQQPALRERLEARFGSAAEWADALAEGEVDLGMVILRFTALARSLEERNEALQIALLYQILLGQWPDAHGIASWRATGGLPELLVEALYYAPQTRERWLE